MTEELPQKDLAPPAGTRSRAHLTLRAKALVLLIGLMFGFVAIAVVMLIDANRAPVKDTEQMLQSAVLSEVTGDVTRRVGDLESDAVAVAAILGRASSGAIKDDDAIEAIRALISTRETIRAVRFEIPSAGFSTIIRREDEQADVPAAPEELRLRADAPSSPGSATSRVAFGLIGPGHGLIVTPVPARPDAPKAYVVINVDLLPLREDLASVAARRFGGRNVRILIATPEGQAVASYAVGLELGGDARVLPIWSRLSGWERNHRRLSIIGEHTEQGVVMISAVETIPEIGWVVAVWRPASVAYAALDEMRRRGMAVAAAALVMALASGVLAARSITRPVLHLVAQARLIGQRKWSSLSLASRRKDELGELARSLGAMANDLASSEAEIARQAKTRADLGRFLDESLVDRIVSGEHPLELGGERASVTVLFADVVGFTPLAEARSPERMVALLNELFTMLGEIVFRHEGTIDKFIGDCLMAVWGVPVAQPDHATRALAAAEDMLRFLESANEEWATKYDVEIRLALGINSGEVVVGNIGSRKRMDYTVIGDVVNVAARLEGVAAANQILVGESTAKLVGSRFALRSLGPQKLTGRATSTELFELERA